MATPNQNQLSDNHYDMIVLGSGPSGQKAAVQAAKLRKKVAVVEAQSVVGGVSTNTGTIPSKSFREAVLYLSGFRERSLYGSSYRVKSRITMEDLTFRISSIIKHEHDVIESQLWRNQIEILRGRASFADPHKILIESSDGGVIHKTADHIVIAVGTTPHHPPGFEVDAEKILDSDQILTMKQLPRNITVVGGGVIGVEYASMFAVLGVPVTLIEQRNQLLSFVDREIVEALQYHMRNLRITLRLGEEVATVGRRDDGQVETLLKSGKKVVSDAVLVSAGRQGATSGLQLESIGLEADKYGRIKVNDAFQTQIPHIYAVGDVVGFPALASTGMSQGRRAALHAFGVEDKSENIALPYGIYTIPEISLVGENEASLTEKQIPYETGIARYSESARGQLIGDEIGMLKIIFHRETHQLLGVHVIGEGATELVHVGQAVLHLNGGLEYLTNVVFNYPTLTEAYKVAALDGMNKIRA